MPQALEGIQITTIDCIYIGDSTARKHLFSVPLALNRVEYRGRIVIVAYSLELTAPHGAGVTIDLRGIARLRPERFAEDCRQQYGLRVGRGRSRADRVFSLIRRAAAVARRCFLSRSALWRSRFCSAAAAAPGHRSEEHRPRSCNSRSEAASITLPLQSREDSTASLRHDHCCRGHETCAAS